MMNMPGPPGALPGGIPPPGNPGAPPGLPAPMPPPAAPSSVPQPAPSPTFHELPSRLPYGIQMIDGAQRNCVKALGTLEFIDNPPERAALLALSQDLAKLVTRMTKKTVGKYSNEDEESADSPELSPEDELS